MLQRCASCTQTVTFTSPALLSYSDRRRSDCSWYFAWQKQAPPTPETWLNCSSLEGQRASPFFHLPWFWVKPGQIPNSSIQPDLHHLCFLFALQKLHTWPTSAADLKRTEAVSAPDSLFIYKLPALFSLPFLLLLLLCVWHNKSKSFSLLQATVCNFRSL